jgi:hypothetical protein
LALSDTAVAEEIPHDEEGHEQVHLPEADRHQHRIEEHGGQAQRQGETPGRNPVERGLDQTDGEDEHADECDEIAHRPDRLYQSDTGERPLPWREEQRCERGIGERQARIREHEGVEVGRKDVPSAQP